MNVQYIIRCLILSTYPGLVGGGERDSRVCDSGSGNHESESLKHHIPWFRFDCLTAGRRHFLKILALDTSTARGSVALLDDRSVAAEFRLHSLETHSARLLRSIDFLLSSAGWQLSDLDLVASGIGPGSFTG